MAEVGGNLMIVNGSPADASKQSQVNTKVSETGAKNSLKRKRAPTDGNAAGKDKESLVAECRRELDELFGYYREVSAGKLHLGEGVSPYLNSAVACLIEESSLPFSKLAEEVYEKLKAREGNQGITLASVRSAVLFVGQRMMYGIPNADADVLEDESESCLWCWEVMFIPNPPSRLLGSSLLSFLIDLLQWFLMLFVAQTRDMKLLPTAQRGILNVRRIARKKIHERISALSGKNISRPKQIIQLGVALEGLPVTRHNNIDQGMAALTV